MPPTAPDLARQAARYKGIVGLARRYLDLLWPRVDWASPKAQDAVTQHYQAIVHRHGAGAASVAAQHYDDMRAAAGARGRYRAFAADPAPQEQVAKIVASAFLGHDSETDTAPDHSGEHDRPGHGATEQLLEKDEPKASAKTTSDLPVDQRVQARLEDQLSRLVLQPARDTIEQNAAKDPAKARWIRVPTGPTTCEFCIMLASRELGPNFTGYSSEHSALFDNLGNSYHKNCDCVARPVFPGEDGRDVSPHMSEYNDIYEKAVERAGTRRDAKKILAEMRQVIKEQGQPPVPDPVPTPAVVPSEPVNLDIPTMRGDSSHVPPHGPPHSQTSSPSDNNPPLVPADRISEEPGRHPQGKPAEPPAIETLWPQAAHAGDPDRFFLPSEQSTAQWLRDAGNTVISVERRAGEFEKTPDALVQRDQQWAPLEIKALTAPSVSAVARLLRQARKQARIAVVDGAPVSVSRSAAEAGLREAVRKYGTDFDQILVRLGDGTAIYWVL